MIIVNTLYFQWLRKQGVKCIILKSVKIKTNALI